VPDVGSVQGIQNLEHLTPLHVVRLRRNAADAEVICLPISTRADVATSGGQPADLPRNVPDGTTVNFRCTLPEPARPGAELPPIWGVKGVEVQILSARQGDVSGHGKPSTYGCGGFLVFWVGG
jgi:hypothetical protein